SSGARASCSSRTRSSRTSSGTSGTSGETVMNEQSQQSQTDAWRSAIASRRTQVTDPESVPAAMVTPLDQDVSRRNFIRASFWGGLGLTLLGSVGFLLDFLYPRNVRGFGGPVPAGNVADYPRGGEPIHNGEGQFWLANMDPA